MSVARREGEIVDLREYRRRRAQAAREKRETAPVYMAPAYAWFPMPVFVLLPVWLVA